MEIIEDKFNHDKRVTCEWCNSIFEYDEEDIRGISFRDPYVCCPCCGERNYLNNSQGRLTIDNLKFPENFYHFGTNEDTLHIEDEEILEWIRTGVEKLRNGEANEWIVKASGDAIIWITSYPEDEVYTVDVARGYYEVNIPFEDIDYEITE